MMTKDRHALPEKFIGYEILLDETCVPEMPEISGKNFFVICFI